MRLHPELLPPYSLSPSTPPLSLDHGLQVHLEPFSLTASWCISKLAQSQPPSIPPNWLHYALQIHPQSRSITASEWSSKFTPSRPPCVSPNTLYYHLQVHLDTCWIMASVCIAEFTWSRCGEPVELEGRQPINKTTPHLAWQLKGILEKERFWLEERRNRVSTNHSIPGHAEPHKLCRSMNAWQTYVRKHTNWVDLWHLGNRAWDIELGKTECVCCIMRWCLSNVGCPKYILPVTESISVISVSPYV